MDGSGSVQSVQSISSLQSVQSVQSAGGLPPNCTLIADDEQSVGNLSVESVYTAYNTQRQGQTIKIMNSQVVSKQYRNGGSILKGNVRYDLGNSISKKTKNNKNIHNSMNSPITSTKRLVKSVPLLSSLEKTSSVSGGQVSIKAKRDKRRSNNNNNIDEGPGSGSGSGCMWTYAPIASTAEAPWLRNKTNATINKKTRKSLYKVYSAAPNLPTPNGNELNTRSVDSTVWKESFSEKVLPKENYNLEAFSSKIMIPCENHEEITYIADPVVRQQVQMDRDMLASVRMPVGIKLINHKKWDDEKRLRNHDTDCTRIAKNVRIQNQLVRVSFENFTENCRKGKLQMEMLPTKLPSVVYPVLNEIDDEENSDISGDNIPDDISEMSTESIDRTITEISTSKDVGKGIEYNYNDKRHENEVNDDSTCVSLMTDNTHATAIVQ